MTIYKETALNDLDNYLFKARASLDKVRIAYEDPMGKDYISIRDPQYLINAKVQRDDALRMLDTSEQLVNQAKMVKSYDSIITALDSLDLGLDQVALTLDSMFNALLNSLTTPTFPESSLETLKTSIKAEQTTTTGGIAALQLDKSNLQTKKLYYDNAVVAAENVMKIKKQAWELAKAQYGATVADPKPSDVDYYQALVDQARAQVAAVRQKMSDRAISAPVNGVVTKVNNKVGELSSLTAPVLIMLGDQDYEIEVDVPESDIAKISVGDDASLTLDAFGEDIKFTGKIVLIEPAQTEISGVIYYKVKINLDKTDKDIKPGMTANVDILAAEKNDVLVIPQRAIVDDKVKVLVDPQTKKVEEKSVVVGLKGDDGLAEIVSGLNEGEEVVTYTKNGTK
jgi:RND family efflux transporter MFP subunit